MIVIEFSAKGKDYKTHDAFCYEQFFNGEYGNGGVYYYGMDTTNYKDEYAPYSSRVKKLSNSVIS